MGVGSRLFQTFLCDGCGQEIIAEEGSTVDGYYIEVLRVYDSEQVSSENVYACSEVCIPQAIRDGLKREALPEGEKLTATQELWIRGQQIFLSSSPPRGIPVLDDSDHSRVIGTAHEIANYKPPTK